MSKILNTKSLVIILAIAVALYFISTLFEKKERTFKSDLVSVDTAEVTAIEIIPRAGESDAIQLTRTGQGWSLEKEGVTYNADQMAARNVLAELIKLTPERVAANDPSRWDEMEVSDTTGTRVKLYDGKKVVADIYIGKFNYQQNPQAQQMQFQQQGRGKMSTHVRLAGEDEVYVVDGFLKMNIQADLNTYRNKNLCSVLPEDVTKVTFRYPDNSFTLAFQDSTWKLNGVKTDSVKTVQYLNSLRRLTSTNFVDDAADVAVNPSHTVRIEGNNFMPVEIKAFPADSVNGYLVTSSLNSGARFSGEKSKLFDKIFKGIDNFLPTVGDMESDDIQ